MEAIFYGQDRGSTCAKMTALNLRLFNMDGYAAYGDSLTMGKHQVWQTQGSIIGGVVWELEERGFSEIDYEAVKSEYEQVEEAETKGELVGVEYDGGIDLTDF